MGISVETDFSVNATYITLSDEPIVRTVEINDLVNVDLDQYGVAVGVELLSTSAALPFDRLCTDFHVHSDVVNVLRMLKTPDLRDTSEGLTDAGSPQRDFQFV